MLITISHNTEAYSLAEFDIPVLTEALNWLGIKADETDGICIPLQLIQETIERESGLLRSCVAASLDRQLSYKMPVLWMSAIEHLYSIGLKDKPSDFDARLTEMQTSFLEESLQSMKLGAANAIANISYLHGALDSVHEVARTWICLLFSDTCLVEEAQKARYTYQLSRQFIILILTGLVEFDIDVDPKFLASPLFDWKEITTSGHTQQIQFFGRTLSKVICGLDSEIEKHQEKAQSLIEADSGLVDLCTIYDYRLTIQNLVRHAIESKLRLNQLTSALHKLIDSVYKQGDEIEARTQLQKDTFDEQSRRLVEVYEAEHALSDAVRQKAVTINIPALSSQRKRYTRGLNAPIGYYDPDTPRTKESMKEPSLEGLTCLFEMSYRQLFEIGREARYFDNQIIETRVLDFNKKLGFIRNALVSYQQWLLSQESDVRQKHIPIYNFYIRQFKIIGSQYASFYYKINIKPLRAALAIPDGGHKELESLIITLYTAVEDEFAYDYNNGVNFRNLLDCYQALLDNVKSFGVDHWYMAESALTLRDYILEDKLPEVTSPHKPFGDALLRVAIRVVKDNLALFRTLFDCICDDLECVETKMRQVGPQTLFKIDDRLTAAGRSAEKFKQFLTAMAKRLPDDKFVMTEITPETGFRRALQELIENIYRQLKAKLATYAKIQSEYFIVVQDRSTVKFRPASSRKKSPLSTTPTRTDAAAREAADALIESEDAEKRRRSQRRSNALVTKAKGKPSSSVGSKASSRKAKSKASAKPKAAAKPKSNINAKASCASKASAKPNAAAKPKSSVSARASLTPNASTKPKATAKPKSTASANVSFEPKASAKAKATTKPKSSASAKATSMPKASAKLDTTATSKSVIAPKQSASPKATVPAVAMVLPNAATPKSPAHLQTMAQVQNTDYESGSLLQAHNVLPQMSAPHIAQSFFALQGQGASASVPPQSQPMSALHEPLSMLQHAAPDLTPAPNLAPMPQSAAVTSPFLKLLRQHTLPSPIQEVMLALSSASLAQPYVYGGAVLDWLLGFENSNDVDIILLTNHAVTSIPFELRVHMIHSIQQMLQLDVIHDCHDKAPGLFKFNYKGIDFDITFLHEHSLRLGDFVGTLDLDVKSMICDIYGHTFATSDAIKSLTERKLTFVGNAIAENNEIVILRRLRFYLTAKKRGADFEMGDSELVASRLANVMKTNPIKLSDEIQKHFAIDLREDMFNLWLEQGIFATLFPELDADIKESDEDEYAQIKKQLGLLPPRSSLEVILRFFIAVAYKAKMKKDEVSMSVSDYLSSLCDSNPVIDANVNDIRRQTDYFDYMVKMLEHAVGQDDGHTSLLQTPCFFSPAITPSATPKFSGIAPKRSTAAPKATLFTPKVSMLAPKQAAAMPKVSAATPNSEGPSPKRSAASPKVSYASMARNNRKH